MQLVVNIDDEKFKEISEGALKSIPDEMMQEIVLEGVRSYLKDSEILKNLFVEVNTWGSIRGPSEYLNRIVGNSIPDEKVKEMREEIFESVRNNYDKILRMAFIEMLSRSLFQGQAFEDSFREVLRKVECERNNPSY